MREKQEPIEPEFIANPAEALAENISSDEQRLQFLESIFLEIASAQSGQLLSDGALNYMHCGGSLRLALREIDSLSPRNEVDENLDSARENFMQAVLHKPKLRLSRVDHHQQIVVETQETYVDSIVAKMKSLIEGSSPEDSLHLREMPTILERSVFTDSEHMNLRNLSANHLYLLVDVALKEHIKRREFIDDHHSKNPVARALGSRAVRVGLAGSVFFAAVGAHGGFIPESDEILADNIEAVLKGVSALILGLEAPELIRYHYLNLKHNKRTQELHEELAENKELADLALRMAYNSTRYGSGRGSLGVTNRLGTDDKEENLRRFSLLDQEFAHMNNDPTGKPYSGDQALGYAARLLIERNGMLESIVGEGKSGVERETEFLELTHEIINEDLTRMKKGLSESRFRHQLVRFIAVAPTLLFSPVTSVVSDASTLSRDTAKTMHRSKSQLDD